MRKLLSILVIIQLLNSCNLGNHSVLTISNLNTTITYNNTDTIPKKSIEQQKKELPYFDSLTMFKGGLIGYQDTFTVDSQKFRIIHHDSIFDGVVQKYVNNNWLSIIDFRRLGYKDDYVRTEDVNGDGYNDIITKHTWSGFAYLYNPNQQSFNAKEFSLPFMTYLLDTTRKVYCNYEDVKGIFISSELYTIQNYKQIVHYIVEFKEQYNVEPEFRKATLYKCSNGNVKNKIKIRNLTRKEVVQIYSEKNANYINWWRTQYKKMQLP
jgi:hypothetical protein